MIQNLLAHMEEFNISVALILLFTYTCIDAMYAYYTTVVTEKRPLASANISFVMHFFIAFGVLSYTENYLYIIPIAFGSWAGTYAVVSHQRNKSNR